MNFCSVFNHKLWNSDKVEQPGFFLTPLCGGEFTRIFRFRMSSDCGGGRSLLRRDGTAELVAWELVQVSLTLTSLRSLHVVPVTIVNRHVVRRVRTLPQNDVIFSQNLPIMLALCSMLSCTYYAHFSAGITSAPLVTIYQSVSIISLLLFYAVCQVLLLGLKVFSIYCN